MSNIISIREKLESTLGAVQRRKDAHEAIERGMHRLPSKRKKPGSTTSKGSC